MSNTEMCNYKQFLLDRLFFKHYYCLIQFKIEEVTSLKTDLGFCLASLHSKGGFRLRAEIKHVNIAILSFC